MTSRYHSKRHAPLCAYANCSEPAVTLVLVRGRPEWLCEKHKEQR